MWHLGGRSALGVDLSIWAVLSFGNQHRFWCICRMDSSKGRIMICNLASSIQQKYRDPILIDSEVVGDDKANYGVTFTIMLNTN